MLAGCGGAAASGPPPGEPSAGSGDGQSALADEDAFQPSYAKSEVARALISERGLEAAGERRVLDLEARPSDPATDDQLRVASADLAVRRRFITTLEACEASGRYCPPRLDDPPWAWDPDADAAHHVEPPVTATLRFDLESWRTLANELHGRACACRTISCVDSLGVAIDQLEMRPTVQTQGDEAASLAITRARECLFRLRGRSVLRSGTPAAE